MNNSIGTREISLNYLGSINRSPITVHLEINLLPESGNRSDIGNSKAKVSRNFPGRPYSFHDMMLDDIFQAFVVLGKEQGINKFLRQLPKGLIGRRKGRIKPMHVLEKFSLATRRNCFGENLEPPIFLKALEKIISIRCQDTVNQIDHSIRTRNRFSDKLPVANDPLLIVD